MSINNDGTNQELIFEDMSTINTGNNYFISTGYFRTKNYWEYRWFGFVSKVGCSAF